MGSWALAWTVLCSLVAATLVIRCQGKRRLQLFSTEKEKCNCFSYRNRIKERKVSVSADEDCKWYIDRNGSWHNGIDCNFPSFCCGDCYHRFCCFDIRNLLTERQQKHCMAFGPRTIAGIASAVILFVAIVATIVCCFLCSCCYLYQRRHHMQTPYQGQEIPLSGYPDQPPDPYPMDPKAGPAFHPGYAPVFPYPPTVPAQYPLYPPGPPYYNPSAPPPYIPPQPTQPST